MLLLSVAPEVKTISFGSAPIRSATCCSQVLSDRIEIKIKPSPFEHPLWPSLLPTHKHECDCEDYQTGPSNTGAWHQELGDPREWWPGFREKAATDALEY